MQVGSLDDGTPCYMDRHAWESDGVVIVNRVKAHTAFRAEIESGLCKMLAIGLGKQRGAETNHARGLATTILSTDGNMVRVRDVPRAVVASGTRVELREGCDKRLQTCAERFGNAVNFRGEAHLPGNDLLTRYPGG